MRTTKELLQLMLDNFDEYFNSGLCGLNEVLYFEGIISSSECEEIDIYIYSNPPGIHTTWYWQRGLEAPRKEWLNEHIKLN